MEGRNYDKAGILLNYAAQVYLNLVMPKSVLTFGSGLVGMMYIKQTGISF